MCDEQVTGKNCQISVTAASQIYELINCIIASFEMNKNNLGHILQIIQTISSTFVLEEKSANNFLSMLEVISSYAMNNH